MSLTLAQFQSEVQLACRNMPTSDPYYGAGGVIITRFINRARNEIIRMAIGPKLNINLFPEMQTSWTVGPSYPGTVGRPANEMPRPSNAIAVVEVYRAQQATTPDWSAVKEWPLVYVDPTTFSILQKDSSTANWARMFTRKAKAVLVYPTPTAAFTDYFRFWGIRREDPLVNSGDTFFSDDNWDDVTVKFAAAKIQKLRGWADRAASLMADVKEELLGLSADITALENMGRNDAVTITGAPNRSTVYGR